jgi:hypothetical protein
MLHTCVPESSHIPTRFLGERCRKATLFRSAPDCRQFQRNYNHFCRLKFSWPSKEIDETLTELTRKVKEAGVLPQPRCSLKYRQLLLPARMWLVLGRLRRALVLRSGFRRGLSRSWLWSRSGHGLGPIRRLSRTALSCRSGLRTRLRGRFCGFLDWGWFAFRLDRGCWPGCGRGLCLSSRLRSRARFGSRPRCDWLSFP